MKKISILIITGAPGSGKSSVSKALEKKLNYKLISLADFAIKNKISEYNPRIKEHEVELKDLQKRLVQHLQKEISQKEKEATEKQYGKAERPWAGGNMGFIVEGHLAAEMDLNKIIGQKKAECEVIVIVLRRSLFQLYKIMLERGYTKRKISDNIALEAIDYFGENARRIYKNVFEVVFTSKKQAANKILSIIKGRKIDETKKADAAEMQQLKRMIEKKLILL